MVIQVSARTAQNTLDIDSALKTDYQRRGPETVSTNAFINSTLNLNNRSKKQPLIRILEDIK